jgi:hypothetical protein
MSRSFIAPLLLSAGLAIALVACNGKDNAADTDARTVADADSPLPKPQPTRGSVTGMPDTPGPGTIGAPPDVDPEATLEMDEAGDAIEPVPGEDGLQPDADLVSTGPDAIPPQPAAEPTAEDAVGVVRDYYAAIEARNFAHAWSLWSDNGRASGQTPQQFADGFANTAHVAISTGAPGAMGAAAGSRYIQVPVSIEAAQRDGTVRRYAGSYTLRRAVVDGATASQRDWKLASATLHEVRQ